MLRKREMRKRLLKCRRRARRRIGCRRKLNWTEGFAVSEKKSRNGEVEVAVAVTVVNDDARTGSLRHQLEESKRGLRGVYAAVHPESAWARQVYGESEQATTKTRKTHKTQKTHTGVSVIEQ